MTKIYIDAGHGGSDPGAVANGLREKDLTLDIAKRIKKYLDDNYTGHTIRMSRTTDKTMSLKQRTDDANRWGADFFLSVHINAGGGTGFESFIHDSLRDRSNTAKLRSTIHDAIMKELSVWRDRGKKKMNLHVLRESKMSAMLTENGFIDTSSDVDRLKSNTFLDKIAKGHAVGLAKAFKLKKKSTSSSKPSKTNPKPSKPSKNKGSSTYQGSSIVDYLKSIGQPSSFNHRKALASKHGISNYTGTAAQNTRLLNALRGGKPSTTTSQSTPKSFKVGQKVKIKSSAKKYSRSNVTIPAKYKNKSYTIQQVGKDDVLIKELYSWVKKKDTY